MICRWVHALLDGTDEADGIQEIDTASITEYWQDTCLLSQETEPSQMNASHPMEQSEHSSIFIQCKAEVIHQYVTSNERLMILNQCDLNLYSALFTDTTTLVTDSQTLASISVSVPPISYDFERQVSACIHGLYRCGEDSPLWKLKALVIWLSTASVLVLERTKNADAPKEQWKGVFVYLPNLYNAAQPPLTLPQQYPLTYDAFIALFLAKWIKNDIPDEFGLRNHPRYRLSLALHDALLLNGIFFDSDGVGDQTFLDQRSAWQHALKTAKPIQSVDLIKILAGIRKADRHWHHPLHVPLEHISADSASKPWKLLSCLLLDGFTLARYIWAHQTAER